MNLTDAVCYDEETFPNCFTLAAEALNGDWRAVWEISHFRDDRAQLFEFLQHLSRYQIPMIGFNNLGFDYIVLHFLLEYPHATVEQLYAKSQEIFNSHGRFGQIIWADKRFIPQIDLFKIFHFDNKAKSTSLKYLQMNMRTDSVEDMPIEHGTMLTKEQIDTLIVPYNLHDVKETKRFALHSMDAINFRASLIPQFGVEVMNWNDTKIGEMTVIKRIGDEICYDYSSGRKTMRQTPRTQIALNDIIFPYVQFQRPEFQHVLNYLKAQVLKIDEFADDNYIKTKGVFQDLKAHVGGIDFYFGVGGIHGSLERRRVEATGEWLIRDIDVASLYPSIAIKNNLAPAHLGSAFVQVYSELPKERKKWQQEKGKKCAEANALKLAANGVYGKSNSAYSPFYDPQFTMTITVNGQLLLCMLAERLMTVPTLQILQINTDGITYYINHVYEPLAAALCKEWEALTKLTLEDVNYSRMWLRDVNSYIAEGKDGLKLKGAYWTPDPLDYAGSISNSQPPAWHKDLSNPISVRAAVAHMIHGCDIEQFIRMCTNPYDFMLGIKVRAGDTLLHNGVPQQRRGTRYYVSTNGHPMTRHAPALGQIGAFKKANGVSDMEYDRVMKETGGAWDERVCTKNKSKYESRESAIQAGYLVTICNHVKDFRFDNINYAWYIQEAAKLVI
jgi:hypothetical protein